MTELKDIYDAFLTKATDDMYMEISAEETYNMLYDILKSSLHWFEFPRFDLYAISEELGIYSCDLTQEEINILATYMIVEWLGQQLASVELTRMKYSGNDFKFTS